MWYLNIHVKSLRTHVWHLKGSILKHNMKNASYKFMFFTIQGSLLWGIFPDQTGTVIIMEKIDWKLFQLFVCYGENFSLNRPILCPISNFLSFCLANSISSYLYRNVTKDRCIYFPPCLSSTISSEMQHRVKHIRCTYLSMWMIKFMASKSTAFLAFECWTFLDFGGSYKSQAKFWFHLLFGLL